MSAYFLQLDNQVVIWDRIVRRKRDAKINIEGLKNKYAFKDMSRKGFRCDRCPSYAAVKSLLTFTSTSQRSQRDICFAIQHNASCRSADVRRGWPHKPDTVPTSSRPYVVMHTLSEQLREIDILVLYTLNLAVGSKCSRSLESCFTRFDPAFSFRM